MGVAPGPEGPAALMTLIADDKSETKVELPIRAMAEARLVLTEDLIRAALRREKAALKDAKRPTGHRAGAGRQAAVRPSRPGTKSKDIQSRGPRRGGKAARA